MSPLANTIKEVKRRSFRKQKTRLQTWLWCLLTSLFVLKEQSVDANDNTRLDTGWQFHQGSVGSIWEIWRGNRASDNVVWTPVTLPHCFNARDAVDPDEHYYQGPCWYRIRLKLANPFPNGRTLLHFDGAGQKSQVFVGLKKPANTSAATTSGTWTSRRRQTGR